METWKYILKVYYSLLRKSLLTVSFLRDEGGKNAKTNSRVTLWTKTIAIYFI